MLQLMWFLAQCQGLLANGIGWRKSHERRQGRHAHVHERTAGKYTRPGQDHIRPQDMHGSTTGEAMPQWQKMTERRMTIVTSRNDKSVRI
mmetsp:Transcript_68385/g.114919  ORF Transcript_68385/g.114919 Transcript_68385/m.114919 type:complete len:90 (-) Transcript_68385:404-673(-)